MKGTQHSIRREAEQLEKQFHIENIYKKIRKIYEYDGAEYIIRVPEGAKDILQESKSSAEPDTLSAFLFGKATFSSCERSLTPIRRGTPWRWSRAVQFGRNAVIATTSMQIWKMPSRSSRNGSKWCKAE